MLLTVALISLWNVLAVSDFYAIFMKYVGVLTQIPLSKAKVSEAKTSRTKKKTRKIYILKMYSIHNVYRYQYYMSKSFANQFLFP